MAQTLYGAQVKTSPGNPVNTDGGRIIGDNSEVFTANDLVTVEVGSGTLAVAGSTSDIYGVVLTTQTMGASNETVQKVKPICFPVDMSYEWLMGTNSDLDPLASLGQYYKITGTTGIQQVDVTSGAMTGTARQVICTGVDPEGFGGSGSGSGLRQGLFKFVQISNFTQG
jgi:hypothetical protein